MKRYNRQLLIDGFEQEKLASSHVTVVGVGGLGSAVLTYLAAAGIGNLTLVDGDCVDETNLNRQILHHTEDVGEKKVTSAAQKLHSLNPRIRVIPVHRVLDEKNVMDLETPDILVDALDNMETRLLLNRLSMERSIPLVSATVESFQGTITSISPGRTPCLNCIYSGAPKKRTFPIVGTTAGLLGIMEAQETIKILLEKGDPLFGTMLFVNTLRWEFERIKTSYQPHCPACGGVREAQ